jgi:hypothetical protein
MQFGNPEEREAIIKEIDSATFSAIEAAYGGISHRSAAGCSALRRWRIGK